MQRTNFHRTVLRAKILALAVTNNFQACSAECGAIRLKGAFNNSELHTESMFSSAKMNVAASFAIFFFYIFHLFYLFSYFKLAKQRNRREEMGGTIVLTNTKFNDFLFSPEEAKKI